MVTCPNCKKDLVAGTITCSRCKADLGLLVHYMNDVEQHLGKAESALQAGDLGEATWAYLQILELDPENATAKRQISKVATAIRQFDEAKRTGQQTMFLLGIGAAAVALVIALALLVGGFMLGSRWSGGKLTFFAPAPPTTPLED